MKDPKPISIKFPGPTRERLKMIGATLGYSENNLVNLCVEAIFEMIWKGVETPQIVKLLRAGLEDDIRRERIGSWEEARSLVFELAAAEDVSPKMKKALRDYDRAIQAEKRKVSYSATTVSRAPRRLKDRREGL